MKVNIFKTVRDAEGGQVRVEDLSNFFTPRELADFLRFHVYCGRLSQSDADIHTIGSDVSHVYVNDTSILDGTREGMELGYVGELSLHYDQTNPYKHKKLWRRALAILDSADRLIH